MHLHSTFIQGLKVNLSTSTDNAWSVYSVEIEKLLLPLSLRGYDHSTNDIHADFDRVYGQFPIYFTKTAITPLIIMTQF